MGNIEKWMNHVYLYNLLKSANIYPNRITIKNYKKLCVRYIILETDNKGKEFNAQNNDILYDGELLGGKRNGKGVEYNHEGKIVYEGEFLDGKRHGNGKEYNLDGELIFNGTYNSGNRFNGKGKEYLANGTLFFEGEYQKGLKNGKGKEYYDNGFLSFE